MLSDFINQLQHYNFTADDIEKLISSSKLEYLKPKHVIAKQNDHSKSFYFLLEGLCHASYLTVHGKAFNKEFYWKGDWVVGFEGVINNEKSPYTLETLTATTLLSLPIEYIHQWRSLPHPFYLKLIETQLVYKERKERFMLLYSPQSRYEIFCQNYPDLRAQLSDYQVAAYLGITHISLSRIKNRIRKLT
ncbi:MULTISPECIES: Crp/Fnr family transcriptional regulator [unclassified Aliivibrio]|jgi:CRP-like cAMP-binding protein|uniref:Crp/Fnr family transcriptional regulator n=1 Tax=unclassified Aliivibrio TaxID=2645654 RepID=UPI00080EB8A1|nr:MULTISPECIES: cyclic nucleotide-binding domain-containing protein [unclassified Aliivibrio]OCH11464.1 Crp/Fnr family transcriptional regulator [Aliivibrio sp. 1S128]OCH16825.1 Crp/Fnr family transcriptional regulator [Aliivibrio sp. 1S165]OCH29555.1 Crp/Fnr family transcriptional regulator [Aliivibrio sp. 1S175]